MIFWTKFSGGSRPSDKGGGGGHPDPEIRGARPQKICFRPLGPHFGLKIRGGHVPRAPPLDPPLELNVGIFVYLLFCSHNSLINKILLNF